MSPLPIQYDDTLIVDLDYRLSEDLKDAAAKLSAREARYLVDYYYQMQGNRIVARNQETAGRKASEPTRLVAWLGDNMAVIERRLKTCLHLFSQAHPVGRWAESITGIGPVISAGLLAHIDLDKAPHVGHIYGFAGLLPNVEWKKGQKRPWNAALKSLCWKCGECLIRTCNNPRSYYGPYYLDRKALETARNDAGEFAEEAARQLARFNYGKTTEAYKAYSQGKLPPAHVHARVRRWLVKLFLSHWHHRALELERGVTPPLPYAHAHLGHVDLIPPPPLITAA